MRDDLETDVLETSAYAQGVARESSPIFRGTLVNSIQVEPVLVVDLGNGIRIQGGVFTATPYAVVQDEGRRPGAPMPPLAPIQRWVELKVRRGDMQMPADIDDMSDQLRSDAAPNRRRRRARSTASRIRGLAYVIARSIGRKGIVAKHFMQKAEAAATVHLEARVNATVARWVDRLGGA